MSVRTELARLEKAKQDIKAAVAAKGVTIPAKELLSTYAEYIAQIINLPLPTADGEYVLVCVYQNGNYTFSWELLDGDIVATGD